LIVYLDASALVALLSHDALSDTAHAVASKFQDTKLTTSDLGALEFASAIARQVRMKSLGMDGARKNLNALDALCSISEVVEISPTDLAQATTIIRRLNLNLRTADAIHIALCQRLNLTLWTFDKGMATCAKKLGLSVLDI
jgi:uncharacterized protein